MFLCSLRAAPALVGALDSMLSTSADLLRRPEALALVDELFVELHFYAPSLRWVHLTHSMKQAFDVLRQLRACGLPVHAWP